MTRQQTIDPADHASEILRGLQERRSALDDLYTENLVDWINSLAVKVDGRNFDFESHEYLRQPYADTTTVCVVQKAAQMGFSIWAMLRVLHRTIRLGPIKVGYFLPTGPKAAEFSQDRFDPMARGIPKLEAIYSAGNVRNILFKQYASSSIFFTHTGGKASTESTPMDYLVFDEVRKMSRTIIATARERLSHSRYKFIDYISTAGYPNDDINYYYNRSQKNEWVNKCPRCNHEFIPHEDWESLKCVDQRRDENGNLTWKLTCPKCGHWGVDPQEGGRWVPTNPDSDWSGYHISQLASRYISLDDIMHEWFGADNRAEFYQSKLGLPYVDEESILVQAEHLQACITNDYEWGNRLPLDSRGVRQGCIDSIIAMGVDQQQGYMVVVVDRFREGISEVIHLEYIYGDDPWRRLAQIHHEFDVDVAVIDAEPNWNEATRYCKAHRGRAWMAYYSSGGGKDIALWHDRVKTDAQASGKEGRMPWHVTIDRVTGFEWSLCRWGLRRNRLPDPQGLVQYVRPRDTLDPTSAQLSSGKMVLVPICSELFMPHMQRLAKERIPKETKSGIEVVGQADFRFVHVGLDPHFAHAKLYADVAMLRAMKMDRSRGTASDIWYEGVPAEHQTKGDKRRAEIDAEQERAESERGRGKAKIPSVEAAPGVVVGAYSEPPEEPRTPIRCPRCGLLWEWENTRDTGREGRVCLPCLSGRDLPKISPIPEHKPKNYARRDHLRPPEDEIPDEWRGTIKNIEEDARGQ